jgi:hypothetical protein
MTTPCKSTERPKRPCAGRRAAGREAWALHEGRKRRLWRRPLSAKAYEGAIKSLCERLGV